MMRVCAEPGCPAIIEGRRCAEHARDYERQRGSRQERGYDAEHDELRDQWQNLMDSGQIVYCTSPTCRDPGVPVDPTRWHLGHDDQRRHRGPEHPFCNLSAGGKAAHRTP
jgi:hypothetical protein